MGLCLAFASIRNDSADNILNILTDYLSIYRLNWSDVPIDNEQHKCDIVLWNPNPSSGWTLIQWPDKLHEPYVFQFVKYAAGAKGWLISGIHVFDEVDWEYYCCIGNRELNGFSSNPGRWIESPKHQKRIANYPTNEALLGEVFGIDSTIIAPYLAKQPSDAFDLDKLAKENPGMSDLDLETLWCEKIGKTTKTSQKAHPNDEFKLSSFWVFTDFWQKMGINYISDDRIMLKRLRLQQNFHSQLPCI